MNVDRNHVYEPTVPGETDAQGRARRRRNRLGDRLRTEWAEARCASCGRARVNRVHETRPSFGIAEAHPFVESEAPVDPTVDGTGTRL